MCDCTDRHAVIDVLNNYATCLDSRDFLTGAALTPYEANGVYRDQLIRTTAGWRITHRRFDVDITLGDDNVLQ